MHGDKVENRPADWCVAIVDNIRVVSFDLEGTLVTRDFSESVWHEGIPSLYAYRRGISSEEARGIVFKEYERVGDQREEWYDIKYWFSVFGLGDYRKVLEEYRDRVSRFPDALPVLLSLGRKYRLIVATGTAREFLPSLLDGLDAHFARVFSSISDFGQPKSPRFYAWVCQEMGVEPHEMVHIGDSQRFDLIAAREAGIRAFHLNRDEKSVDPEALRSLAELEFLV